MRLALVNAAPAAQPRSAGALDRLAAESFEPGFDPAAREVRCFDGASALLAAGHWPELAVVLVRSDAEVDELAAVLPDEVPVLWLVEPGSPVRARPDPGRPSGWLLADRTPRHWQAAIQALALGLSVQDAALALPANPAARASADALPEPLTARELEVYELVAKGLSNRDIARLLNISAHTAKFHVAQILAKTGSATRTEAVGFGLRHGLVGV